MDSFGKRNFCKEENDELKAAVEADPTRKTQSEFRYLKFTEKEISQMPKNVRKLMRVGGYTVHARKRQTGRYKHSIEIRYHKNGYNISVSATTEEEVKRRFLEKIAEVIPQNDYSFAVPTNFHEFAMYWFEHFHKRKVTEGTYKKNLDTYNRDIKEKFGSLKISAVAPLRIQMFLDGYSDKERTAETLYGLFNQIFTCAVKHGIIKLNPLGMCFYKKHERIHGRAIPKGSERKVLNAYANTPYQVEFAIAFYTGLRPNEYATATIDGKFIKARNSKRKGGKVEYKRIPISPMLQPYIASIETLVMHAPCTLAKRFKAILPEYKLYDMRTTFQTRCTECGISDVAIGLFMGNTIGALKETYTDLSDEYLLQEGEKLNY